MGNIQFYNEKVLFANNKVAMHEDCCCAGGPCSSCSSGMMPSFLVTIAGIAEGSCGSCSYFNNPFVLEQWTNECALDYAVSPAVCGIDEIRLLLSAGPQYHLAVELRASNFPILRFMKNLGSSKPNCESISGESLPWEYEGSWTCDGSSATCTVSAL